MDTSTSTLVKPVSKILTDDLNDSADGRAAERSARIGTPQPRCGDDPFLELGMRYAATWKFSSSCKWIYGVFPKIGGTPIIRWMAYVRENPNLTWMMTGGTPVV